jgi:hypothetical protein
MTDENRTDRRFRTEVPVFVSTVLDATEAWIVDVSKQGIRLRGLNIAPRVRVIIEFQGDVVCGTVRWVKPDDTIGVRLDTPLSEGPLASIWARFHQNVSAFGVSRARPAAVFGKKAG